jgi:hypothetical protein
MRPLKVIWGPDGRNKRNARGYRGTANRRPAGGGCYSCPGSGGERYSGPSDHEGWHVAPHVAPRIDWHVGWHVDPHVAPHVDRH